MIIQDGLRRMYAEQENVFYYITVHERELRAAGDAGGRGGGHPEGHVPAAAPAGAGKLRVQLLGSGTILREVLAAAEMLEKDYGVPADVWSVTSFTELRREALDAERWNLLHPAEPPREPVRAPVPRAGATARSSPPPTTCATVPDQIRQWVPGRYDVLGTDGYGRSDTRAALREFFEVDRRYIALAALKALADEGTLDVATVTGRDRALRHRPRQAESGDGLSGGAMAQPDRSSRPDIGDFKDVEVIEVAGEARRHRRRRSAADHARDREGDDGRAVARRRRRARDQGAAAAARSRRAT